MRGCGRALVVAMGVFVFLSALVALSPPASAWNGIDYIIIEDAPGGRGSWVGDGTYYVGENVTFWAAGYNLTDGYIRDVEAYWFSENASVGNVDSWGPSTKFTALSGGTTVVHASCDYTGDPGCNGNPGNQTNTWNKTGTLTVLYRPVDYIVISDSHGGQGAWVGDRDYFEGDSDVFWAAAYNDTLGYVGDVPADWVSGNTSAGTVDPSSVSTTFRAVRPGTTVVTATYNGTVTNATGTLTVRARPTVYVDDDGLCGGFTPCFLTIQEGVDAAGDGWPVKVFDGTYQEHVLVNHSVEVSGESREGVVVDGSGTGTVFLVTGDDVTIETLTVKNGDHGIYVDRANRTRIGNSTVRDYAHGIYLNHTRDAHVAHNLITGGMYGIVTDHAFNDAVRWNDISYNTVYGAKDFDSQLRNCFNWNHFHHNKVAYYYDPDLELLPLEFDGNLLEDNDVAIRVEGASTVVVTNNTLRRNGIGIEIVDASPLVASNVMEDNDVGIFCSGSASLIADNTISGGTVGVFCSDSSVNLDGNSVVGAVSDEIRLEDSSDLIVAGNDLGGGTMDLRDSLVTLLDLVNTRATATATTLGTLVLDESSELSREWYVTFEVSDGSGNAVEGARVVLTDSRGTEVSTLKTGSDGRTGTALVLDRVIRAGSTDTRNPYRVDVSKDGDTVTKQYAITANSALSIVLVPHSAGAPFPWLLLLAVGSVVALGVGGLLSLEVARYALLGLFVPLYIKLKRDRVMDHYLRGRIYQYVEMNPGEHFTAIKKALGLKNGTAVYHLEVLEREGHLRSRADGVFKRFYPADMNLPSSNGGQLSEVQLRIVDVIRDLPGVSQKEIASVLGLRQSTLSYQLSRLREMGQVEAEKDGRRMRYSTPDIEREF